MELLIHLILLLFCIVENLNRQGFVLCRTAYIRQNQYLTHFIAAPVLHLG